MARIKKKEVYQDWEVRIVSNIVCDIKRRESIQVFDL